MSSTPHITGAIGHLDDAAAALRDARVSGEGNTTQLAHYSHVVRGLRDALTEMETP